MFEEGNGEHIQTDGFIVKYFSAINFNIMYSVVSNWQSNTVLLIYMLKTVVKILPRVLLLHKHAVVLNYYKPDKNTLVYYGRLDSDMEDSF